MLVLEDFCYVFWLGLMSYELCMRDTLYDYSLVST